VTSFECDVPVAVPVCGIPWILQRKAAGQTTQLGDCSISESFLRGGLLDWWIGCVTAAVELKTPSGAVSANRSFMSSCLLRTRFHLDSLFSPSRIPLVISALAASAVVHQTTANGDLRVAHDSDREVSPLEQQVHTTLEAIPFVVCLLAALQTAGTPDGAWNLRRKSRPLPAAYVAAVLMTTGATGVLPHLEELWRCVRRARGEDGGADSGIGGAATVTPKDGICGN
jgi:hypothetical protein